MKNSHTVFLYMVLFAFCSSAYADIMAYTGTSCDVILLSLRNEKIHVTRHSVKRLSHLSAQECRTRWQKDAKQMVESVEEGFKLSVLPNLTDFLADNGQLKREIDKRAYTKRFTDFFLREYPLTGFANRSISLAEFSQYNVAYFAKEAFDLNAQYLTPTFTKVYATLIAMDAQLSNPIVLQRLNRWADEMAKGYRRFFEIYNELY